MKAIVNIIVLLFVSSCASKLLPGSARTVKIIKKTKFSKGKNYSGALAYVAKAFGDSSKVIKVKEREQGLIVLKGNSRCNIFRQTGDIMNNYSIHFTLTMNIKNEKIRFLYEDLFIADKFGEPISWAYNQLSSKEKVEESKQCLNPLTNGVLREIGGNSDW